MCGSQPNLWNVPATVKWFMFYTNEAAIGAWVMAVVFAIGFTLGGGTRSQAINDFVSSLPLLLRPIVGFIFGSVLGTYGFLLISDLQYRLGL